MATSIIVNLTATPGLGSLMCRRLWAGLGQLALSVSGFCLITAWMIRYIYRAMMQQLDNPVPPAPSDWLWQWGVLLFGAAWLWSLVTSLSLWHQVKTTGQTAQQNLPPKITGLN